MLEAQPGEVRASGGLVFREGRVAVVHRPGHRDWSFPKGKADPGESDEECALREVREETGIRCELGRELATTRHFDRAGRPKRVRWWLMSPVGGAFESNGEVDELRWLTPEEARPLLTYDRDVVLLEEALSARK